MTYDCLESIENKLQLVLPDTDILPVPTVPCGWRRVRLGCIKDQLRSRLLERGKVQGNGRLHVTCLISLPSFPIPIQQSPDNPQICVLVPTYV